MASKSEWIGHKNDSFNVTHESRFAQKEEEKNTHNIPSIRITDF